MTAIRTSLTRAYKRDMPSTQIVSTRRGITAGQVRMLALAYERAGHPLSDGQALSKTKQLWSNPTIVVAVDGVLTEAGNPHMGGRAWQQDKLDETVRAMKGAR